MPYANSMDANDFGNDCSSQVDTKMGALVYALGAVTFSGGSTPSDFVLPTEGTAADAASQIADGVVGFWGGDTVDGIPGAPVKGGLAVSKGTIDVSGVKSAVEGVLLPYFSAFNAKDSFEGTLASALTAAIATIKVEHTEPTLVGTSVVDMTYPNQPAVG